MKRILLMMLLISLGINTFARKSYVFVTCRVGGVNLSGDIPPTLKMEYSSKDFQDKIDAAYYSSYQYWFGYLVNLLAGEGFVLDKMNPVSENIGFYLFSKEVEGSSDTIQKVKADDDSEAYEVARYNLQGLPVNENDKGIQIVVYSNYTTKTILVQ